MYKGPTRDESTGFSGRMIPGDCYFRATARAVPEARFLLVDINHRSTFDGHISCFVLGLREWLGWSRTTVFTCVERPRNGPLRTGQ